MDGEFYLFIIRCKRLLNVLIILSVKLYVIIIKREKKFYNIEILKIMNSDKVLNK